MTTVMTAVQRLRERGGWPGSGVVGLRELHRTVGAGSSTRATLAAVFAAGAEHRPYAVILARFADDPADPAREVPVERYFREIFTPGSGGLVEYWRDTTLGVVDIGGSQVFGWVTTGLTRGAAGGAAREDLIDAAVRAAERDGHPISTFHRPIAVFTRDWSADDPARPAGYPNWTPADPLKKWWGQWIDGSADGAGRVSAPPHGHSGNFVGHEMGHGLGMAHDVGPNLATSSDYYDPCCIMSQNNSFVHPRWNTAFGPSICLPHLLQRGWMYRSRVYVDSGGWRAGLTGITLPLAPISRPIAKANLGIRLALPGWDYYLEYLVPTGWNRGLPGAYVFVRRLVAIPGAGERCAYLAQIKVPDRVGATATVVEPSGNTFFEVELTSLRGPILKVTARKQ